MKGFADLVVNTKKDRMTHRAFVTRSEHFSAAHRLNSDKLSPEENLLVFGKCSNEHGHGHNYRVYVTVTGSVSEITGMVIDLGVLKELIWSEALCHLDHKHIDKQVDYFRARPSTAENIAIYVWQALKSKIEESGAYLYSVRIQETEHNSAEYRGELTG